MSSTSGNSAAGSVESVKRLRPARTTSRSLSALSVTLVPSGVARRISSSLRPGTVTSPGADTVSVAALTSSTSRSVPVTLRRLFFALSSTFESTGMVWRRSTTPITFCTGPRSSSRVAVIFMF